MSSPLSPDLVAWGASFIPAETQPGQPYWKLIEAHGPYEWGGRVSIFVDVWDEHSNRIVGVPVRMWWADDDDTKPTEPKTGDPFAVDFVMNAGGNAYGVHVADGLPSDQIFGMGLAREPKPHHVFRLIFQRTVAAGRPSGTTPGEPRPDEPSSAREALDRAAHYIDLAKSLL